MSAFIIDGENKMYSKSEVREIAMKQLAIDLNCNYRDFYKAQNTVVIYKKLEGNRFFRAEDYFIYIASFGNGAVISVNQAIYNWSTQFFKDKLGIDLFKYETMIQLDKVLNNYNQKLCTVHEMYLPDLNYKLNINTAKKIKWFERDQIPSLYNDTRFKNAILYETNPKRPDMLAVALYDNDKIAGMAGASADCSNMWQIGIDVLPKYRNKGIGVYLVNLLTEEIKRRNIIPYYGTWCSNIASKTIAQRCGYFPAWSDMNSISTNT